jgi:hypothetical protein
MQRVTMISLAVGLCVISQQSSAGFLSDITTIPNINDTLGKAAKDLKAAAPADTQVKLDSIFADLEQIPDEQLYPLKGKADVCATPKVLDCRGLPSATVKPLVEVAIDFRIPTPTEILELILLSPRAAS